ncbi:MAG: DNA polymerase III subunit gamma/tau [Angelakisella sp.]|nr:DNA polymerase III subunit gamma/tau [Angelakisella sp.]
MYQALYRKWRPQSFEDMVGQEPITTTLKNEIRQGRPAHAYLLVGSRGTGKTTCARLIAKAVNCLSPQDGNPCGTCEICRGIDSEDILDVVEIDAASNNGVDSIRDLREETNFLPNIAKYRVYIMDEAHMLSQGAVNALLKVLEEPPEHVIFILATTEIQKMLPTIISRCQRFDFRRIPSVAIAGRLAYVAGEEGFLLEPEAAQLIGRLADGGMRDALSLLDLCRAHSPEVTVRTVSEAAGLVAQDYLFDIAAGVAKGELSQVIDLIAAVGGQAVEYDRLCSQLAGHFRNLLMIHSSKKPEELILCLPETLERYRLQAKDFSPARLIRAVRVLQEAQSAMSRTSSRRDELELAAIRLCDPRLDQSPEALLERIEGLEAKLNTLLAQGLPAPTVPPEEASAPPRPAAPARTAQPPRPAPAENPSQEAAPFPQWEEVLERLGKLNPAARGALLGSAAYTANGRVLIASDNPVFREMMKTNEYTRSSLKKAIMEVTGTRYGVGPYNGPAPAPKGEEPPAPVEEILRKAKEAGVPVDIQ